VLQPEHSCSRRPASDMPDRFWHLRVRNRRAPQTAPTLCWAPAGIRGPQDASSGESRAHSIHQQPTGRSARHCRRRSSRLTSDKASAAMRGATSASKRAMAAAVVRGLSVLVGRDCAALLASDSSSLACADSKKGALGALRVHAGCRQRADALHRSPPQIQPQPVQVMATCACACRRQVA